MVLFARRRSNLAPNDRSGLRPSHGPFAGLVAVFRAGQGLQGTIFRTSPDCRFAWPFFTVAFFKLYLYGLAFLA